MERSATNDPKSADEEMALLRKELGIRSAADVLDLIRGLKAQIQAMTASAASARTSEAPDTRDPYTAMSRIREFANKVAALNGTIASMENQLTSLYADRERLEKEIGAGEVEDVIAAFRARQATVQNMEIQLSTLYADRAVLDSKLGRSEPEEIVTMFQSVAKLVQDAQRELTPAP